MSIPTQDIRLEIHRLEGELEDKDSEVENARSELRGLERDYDVLASRIRTLQYQLTLVEAQGDDYVPGDKAYTVAGLARLVLDHEDVSGAVRDLAQNVLDGTAVFCGENRLVAAASNLGIFYEGA